MFGYGKSNLLNTLKPIQPFFPSMPEYRFRVSFVPVVFGMLLSLFVVCTSSGSTIIVLAQEPTWRAREGLPVGSEAERYLRVLQLTGIVPPHSWTLRSFAPSELPLVLPMNAEHLWQAQMDFTVEPPVDLELEWIRARVGLVSNSAYPFGENDGGMWTGKGLTALLEGGGFLRYGPLHLRLAPEVSWSENGHFDLADNGYSRSAVYWDELHPETIDRPQRFGEEDYVRMGLGSSVLHLALPGISVGLSGAGQQWGPALHYPLLLGKNAGGFFHLFGQTDSPLDLWAVRLHARYIVGWPTQSDFSPPLVGEGRRFVTGAVMSLTPRGFDGLEVGGARFIHAIPPETGFRIRDAFRLFTGVTETLTGSRNRLGENQLASVFFRWSFPSAGLEIYGEVVKEDYARDLRHIIEEPEDMMGRVFGFQKVWTRSDGRLAVLRAETVNALVHHSERFDRLRLGNSPLRLFYNGGVHQGHTHAGQLLSSPTAYGGSGWTVGADLYHTHGRWTVDVFRALQTEFSTIHSGTEGPGMSDVIYALRLEAVQFYNGVEWRASFTPSLNLNRNLVKENDVFNLNIGLSIGRLPW